MYNFFVNRILLFSPFQKMVSAESGHPVEWTNEKNYMFRLSKLKSDIQNLFSKSKGLFLFVVKVFISNSKYLLLLLDDIITPRKYQDILCESFSDDSLFSDISISRPSNRVHWAIQVCKMLSSD